IAAVGAGPAFLWARRACGEVLDGAAPVSAMGMLAERLGEVPLDVRRSLARAATRWATRIDGIDPERDVRSARLIGASVVVPGDVRWPAGLSGLGPAAPACLWWRGDLVDATGL